MKTLTKRIIQTTLLFLIAFALTTLRAQTTATWIGPAGDEWNTATDWDIAIVPGLGTNVVIGSGAVVNYNVPMASPSIGTMALTGNLTVNASGFDIDGGSTNPVANSLAAGGILNITSSGSVSIANVSNSPSLTVAATGAITNSGTLQFNNTGPIMLANGASPGNAITLNPGSTFTMANTIGSFGINVGTNSSSQGAIINMSNATVTLDKLLTVQGTASAVIINGVGNVNFNGNCRINELNNDGNQRIQITGATNVNLGNFSVYRCNFSTGGLLISNSVVNATGLQIGTGTSKGYAIAAAGSILTNTGVFNISDNTNAASGATDRRSQFLIRGSSTVVSTGPNGIILGNQSNTNPAVGIANTDIGGVLDMSSGTLIAQGITLIKDTTITNAYARLNLSGGTIYLGTIGLVANTGAAHTAFNIAFSGGTLAATADWSSSAPMSITNVATVLAADASSAPHNITLSGVLNGSGTLNKTGSGILTLNAADTYTGNTLVNAGKFTIGAAGSILSSPAIVVASGATLDATALPNGLPINNVKTLQGFGTVLGTVNVGTGGVINPGSNTVTGTLTLGSLVENGGAIYNYFTNSGPNPDFLTLTGDLDVTNVNTIQVNGAVAPSGVYPLIQYGGNFNGGVSNFNVIGATGSLSNNASTKTIYLVTTTSLRSPTNIVWVGNAASNVWDTTVSSNWLDSGSVTRDFFVPGDNVRFDSTGASNPIVNIPGSVTPNSVTVDTPSNYTFYGVGNIGGTGGLTKTNSGTLTILSTNSYTGPTLLNGGVLQVTNLGISGGATGLGAAGSDPSNLVMNASTLQYIGPTTSTDHGITLTNSGGTIDVVSGTTLTLNGTLIGNGSLTVTDAGRLVLAGGNSYTNGTTVVGSTLQLNSATGAGTGSITFSNGTLVYFPSAGITIANPFNFTPATTNLIVVTSGTSANPLANGAWSGDGLLLISNTFNPYTVNGSLDGFTGTIRLLTTNAFRFNSGGGNSMFGSTNATFDLGTATLTCRNAGTMNIGALTGGPSSFLVGQGADSGTVTWSIGNNNLSTIFSGSILNSTNTRLTAITKVGTGTLTLQGSNTYTGATTVDSGTLQVDGEITASAITVPGGVLAGDGVLSGTVDIQSGGTLIPGDGIGVMTIDNTLSLESGSTNIFELDAALGTNATISLSSSVTYGGNLIVTNIAGTLSAGQIFTLFTAAGGYGGAFDTITLPQPGHLLTWDTSQLNVNGTIAVVAVVPPNFSVDFSAFRSSGTITFNSTNGTPGGPVSVLASTNVASPLTNWTAVTNGNYDGSGNFTAPILVSPTGPRQFFILSVP